MRPPALGVGQEDEVPRQVDASVVAHVRADHVADRGCIGAAPKLVDGEVASYV